MTDSEPSFKSTVYKLLAWLDEGNIKPESYAIVAIADGNLYKVNLFQPNEALPLIGGLQVAIQEISQVIAQSRPETARLDEKNEG